MDVENCPLGYFPVQKGGFPLHVSESECVFFIHPKFTIRIQVAGALRRCAGFQGTRPAAPIANQRHGPIEAQVGVQEAGEVKDSYTANKEITQKTCC